MMLFWLIALLLIIVALVICIRSLLLARQKDETVTADDNAALLQQRLDELNSDLDNGVITPEEAENSRKEIQLATLGLQTSAPSRATTSSKYNRVTALFLVTFVPVFVFLFYAYLGRPDLLTEAPTQASQQGPITAAQIEQMVAGLEQRLDENPEDVEGWQMLYRSYMVLERYEDALLAAEKLYELEGEKPEVLLRYVDALAMANDQQLTGKPTEIIERILEIEPDNASALWLAGMAARDRGELQQALQYWEGLLPRLEEGSQPKQQLQQMIGLVRQQMGNSLTNLDPETVSITVNVYLAPGLQEAVKDEAALFIYVRSQDNNAVPIAMVKEPIIEFPVQVTLDNTDITSNLNKLGDFTQVQLIARVSNSGQVKPENGDLVGAVSNISPFMNSPVDLVIRDRIQL